MRKSSRRILSLSAIAERSGADRKSIAARHSQCLNSIRSIARPRIPLPPLAEQRRIAEVLDRAEALRAKRRAALAQLDSLTQSLFLDLFGDPATNPKKWPECAVARRYEIVCSGTRQAQIFLRKNPLDNNR